MEEDSALPEDDGAVTEISIISTFTANPGAFNADGIEVAEDGTLIIVMSNTGQLFGVGAESGERLNQP